MSGDAESTRLKQELQAGVAKKKAEVRRFAEQQAEISAFQRQLQDAHAVVVGLQIDAQKSLEEGQKLTNEVAEFRASRDAQRKKAETAQADAAQMESMTKAQQVTVTTLEDRRSKLSQALCSIRLQKDSIVQSPKHDATKQHLLTDVVSAWSKVQELQDLQASDDELRTKLQGLESQFLDSSPSSPEKTPSLSCTNQAAELRSEIGALLSEVDAVEGQCHELSVEISERQRTNRSFPCHAIPAKDPQCRDEEDALMIEKVRLHERHVTLDDEKMQLDKLHNVLRRVGSAVSAGSDELHQEILPMVEQLMQHLCRTPCGLTAEAQELWRRIETILDCAAPENHVDYPLSPAIPANFGLEPMCQIRFEME